MGHSARDRHHAAAHCIRDWAARGPLLWDRLCGWARGGLLGSRPRGALARAGCRAPRLRDDRRRRGGTDRRSPLSRHRPVAALQGRPAADRAAPIRRPRRIRRNRHRHDRRLLLCPPQGPAIPPMGRCGRARACSRCRPSPAGGTSSTRSSMAPRRTFHGGSRSNASTGPRAIHARRAPIRLRPSVSTSSRCSCTNPCQDCLAPSS